MSNFYLMMFVKASFQAQDFQHMQFPSQMYVDYIRVYQRSDVSNGIGCNPPNRPTADYITKYTTPSILLPTDSDTPFN
jgi:hypothetical protein